MAKDNKTKPTEVSPEAFVAAVENPKRRADGEVLLQLMEDVSGEKPVMWGPSIVGFGKVRYRYESGREGDMCRLGFSPRKAHLVIYNWSSFEGGAELIGRLGKVKNPEGCLYVNKLEDIDLDVLRELLKRGYEHTFEMYPTP